MLYYGTLILDENIRPPSTCCDGQQKSALCNTVQYVQCGKPSSASWVSPGARHEAPFDDHRVNNLRGVRVTSARPSSPPERSQGGGTARSSRSFFLSSGDRASRVCRAQKNRSPCGVAARQFLESTRLVSWRQKSCGGYSVLCGGKYGVLDEKAVSGRRRPRI